MLLHTKDEFEAGVVRRVQGSFFVAQEPGLIVQRRSDLDGTVVLFVRRGDLTGRMSIDGGDQCRCAVEDHVFAEPHHLAWGAEGAFHGVASWRICAAPPPAVSKTSRTPSMFLSARATCVA